MKEEKHYISLMAVRKREALEKHMRPAKNEWMLEEMHEFVDEVSVAAYQAFKHGKMTKKQYQDTVDAAMNEWSNLTDKVKAHEEEEDFILRLSGQIVFDD